MQGFWGPDGETFRQPFTESEQHSKVSFRIADYPGKWNFALVEDRHEG